MKSVHIYMYIMHLYCTIPLRISPALQNERKYLTAVEAFIRIITVLHESTGRMCAYAGRLYIEFTSEKGKSFARSKHLQKVKNRNTHLS